MIEAALKALNIAPGIRRRFAAQSWKCFQNGVFDEVRREASAQVRRDAVFEAFASDIDPEAVRLTRENAAKAGVAGRIHVRQADIKDFAPEIPEGRRGVLITNPPYGERLLAASEAEEICRTMGQVFPQRDDLGYYIISPHDDFEGVFGREAVRRRKLYNGMIKCQVYMYFNSRHGEKA